MPIDTTYQLNQGESLTDYGKRIAAYNASKPISASVLTGSTDFTAPTYAKPILPDVTSPLSEGLGAKVDAARAEQSATLGDLKAAVDTQGTEQAKRTQLEGAYRIPDLNNTLSELSAQDAQYQADLSNLDSTLLQSNITSEDRLAPTFAIRGEQAQAARQAEFLRQGINIRRATNAAAFTAANGRLALAQDYVQKALDSEFKPLESKISYLQQVLALNKDSLNRTETAQLNQVIQENQRDYDTRKANRESILKVLTTAAQYGADAKTIAAIQTATTPEEAVALAGSALRDPKAQYELEGLKLENQLRAAQIENVRADTAKTRSEIQTAGAPIMSVSDTGTPASGVKLSALNAITGLKLTESQSNAVSYAFRMIEANSNINNLIGNGTDEKGTYNPTTLGSALGRFAQTDNARTLDRDLENFIRAQLRKESGAQIADTEMEGGKKIYSPQGILTNDKDIVATKATREQAIQSMIAQAGPAGAYLEQYFNYIQSGGLSPEERAIIYGGSSSSPAIISGAKYF